MHAACYDLVYILDFQRLSYRINLRPNGLVVVSSTRRWVYQVLTVY